MASLTPPAVAVLVVDSLLLFLSTIVVGLRFVSIHRLKRDTRLHDWLCVTALVQVQAGICRTAWLIRLRLEHMGFQSRL